MADKILCRLCLDVTNSFVETQDEVGDITIADIVSQHLCFDVKQDDHISNKICGVCWEKTAEFHDFYEKIQKAQQNIAVIYGSQISILDEKSQLNQEIEQIVVHNGQVEHITFGNLKIEEHIEDGLSGMNENIIENIESSDENFNQQLEEGSQTEQHHEENFAEKSLIFNDEKGVLKNICISQEVPVEENSVDDTIIQFSAAVHQESLPAKSEVQTNPSQKINIRRRGRRKTRKKSEDIRKCRSPSKEKENSDDGGGSVYIDEGCDSDYDDYIPEPKVKRSRRTSKKESAEAEKEKHEKYIESYYKMICEVCSENCEQFEKLFDHYQTVHSIRGFIMCCGKQFFKRPVIAEHILWHTNPELFKCSVCNKIYADKRCLNNHLLAHAPPEMKLYKCEHCPKSFVKKFKLDKHKLSHLSPSEKKYICDECEKPYASDALLRAHKRVVHEKTYAHMCEICAKVFKSRVFFEKHQLEHLGQNLPRVQCKICDAWMKNEHTMRAHMRLHQDEGMVHECDICGKQGPSRNAILKHKRFVHLSERKFKCNLCDKAFKRAITLKEHMTVHTGEVLYTCTFCPKTFNSGANMHAHKKKAHPTEWEAEKKVKQLQFPVKAENDGSTLVN